MNATEVHVWSGNGFVPCSNKHMAYHMSPCIELPTDKMFGERNLTVLSSRRVKKFSLFILSIFIVAMDYILWPQLCSPYESLSNKPLLQILLTQICMVVMFENHL